MEFHKFSRDRYFDDTEVQGMFDRITRPLEGPTLEAEPIESQPQTSNGLSRDEFASTVVGLMDLMRQLIESVKNQPRPVVNVSPEIVALIAPTREVKSVSRDATGKIESITSEIK